jgi:hypothetical protein
MRLAQSQAVPVPAAVARQPCKKAEGGVYQGSFETAASRDKVLRTAAPFIASARTL